MMYGETEHQIFVSMIFRQTFHEVSPLEEGGRALVSNEAAANVSVIDAISHSKVTDIPIGTQGMVLTPDERLLIVANYRSNSVSVIDVERQSDLGEVAVCEGPVDVALSAEDGEEWVYVVCFSEGAVSVVDVERLTETQRIPVGEHPFGIIAHPTRNCLYVAVGGSNWVVVLDGGSRGREAETFSEDEYSWGGLAGTWFWIDPAEDLIFVGMIQQLGEGRPDVRSLARRLTYQAILETCPARSMRLQATSAARRSRRRPHSRLAPSRPSTR